MDLECPFGAKNAALRKDQMARANRQHIPGQVWHIIRRCIKNRVPSPICEGPEAVVSVVVQGEETLRVEFLVEPDETIKVMPVTASVTELKGIVPRPERTRSLEEMDQAIADGVDG
jgi:hypothetical protein